MAARLLAARVALRFQVNVTPLNDPFSQRTGKIPVPCSVPKGTQERDPRESPVCQVYPPALSQAPRSGDAQGCNKMSRVYIARDQDPHLLTTHGEVPWRFIPAGARQPGKERGGAVRAGGGRRGGSARRRSERPVRPGRATCGEWARYRAGPGAAGTALCGERTVEVAAVAGLGSCPA